MRARPYAPHADSVKEDRTAPTCIPPPGALHLAAMPRVGALPLAYVLSVACLATCAQPPPPPDLSVELHPEIAFSADGKPQGPYRLRDGTGRLYAAGEFAGGRREGLWTFWDGAGIKIVELTYRRGIKEGPCRMWFGSVAFQKVAGRLKLDVTFAKGRQDGLKRTWWPSGGQKCETELRRGAVRSARCWNADGGALSPAEATQVARADLAADYQYLRAMEEVVRVSLRQAAAAQR